METEREFYICPTCFHVSEAHPEWHEHKMLRYPGYPAGHPQLKPPVDDKGNLKARAPRWFLKQKQPIPATIVREDRQTRDSLNQAEWSAQQERVRLVLQLDSHPKSVIGETGWTI
jgi:hypothetical protein